LSHHKESHNHEIDDLGIEIELLSDEQSEQVIGGKKVERVNETALDKNLFNLFETGNFNLLPNGNAVGLPEGSSRG
jgi:hypothetical protein